LYSEWYILKSGQQEGPFTWEQLWQQARSGQIQPADQVWKEGMPGWAAAVQFPGLFDTAKPPTPPLPLPASALPPHTGQPFPSGAGRPTGKKGPLVALIILLLILACSGAAYFFLTGGFSAKPKEFSVVGAWAGEYMGGIRGYVQFFEDGTMRQAFPDQGLWHSTSYRMEREEGNGRLFLYLYDPAGERWLKYAQVVYLHKENKLIINHLLWNVMYGMQRIEDREFQEVIDSLEEAEYDHSRMRV